MAKSSKCPQCGALTAIPPTGLQMTCDYCGLARPVPDAEKRRQRMEREEQRRRKAEEKARRAAGQTRGAGERRGRAGRSPLGRLLALPFKLLPLVAIGAVAYFFVYEPLRGDPGNHAYRQAAAELVGEGYRPVGEPTVMSAFAFKEPEIFLDVKRGRCYGLAVGAGKRIERVDLRARRRVTKSPYSPQATVLHCAARTGTLKAAVRLEWAGRFTWALFQREGRPAPAAKPEPRKTRRRPRRRRRPKRQKPAPPRPTLPGPSGTDRPPDPPDNRFEPPEIKAPPPIKLPPDEIED